MATDADNERLRCEEALFDMRKNLNASDTMHLLISLRKSSNFVGALTYLENVL